MKSCFKQKLLTTHVSLNKKAEYYCNIGCGVCTLCNIRNERNVVDMGQKDS